MTLTDKNICVCLWSDDYEKLAKWYEETLGFTVRKKLSYPTDTGVDFDFGDNYFFIGQHDKIAGENKDPYRIMVGFNVGSVTQTYRELEKKNVKIVAKPFLAPSGTFWCMTIADPEENTLQFYGNE